MKSVAQGWIQSALEKLQGWRQCNLLDPIHQTSVVSLGSAPLHMLAQGNQVPTVSTMAGLRLEGHQLMEATSFTPIFSPPCW